MSSSLTYDAALPAPSAPSAEAADTSSPRGAGSPSAVTGAPLFLLRLEGAVALVAACAAYASLGGSLGWFVALFLAPDLAMLGLLAGPRVGAFSYNAVHTFFTPALLAALGLGLGAPALVLGACILAAHIGFDRMLGYGLKFSSGFGDTHLGLKGRRA